MQHMIKRMNKTGTAIVVDSRIATVMEIRGCSAIRKAQQATKRVTHGWSTLIAVIMGCPLTARLTGAPNRRVRVKAVVIQLFWR